MSNVVITMARPSYLFSAGGILSGTSRNLTQLLQRTLPSTYRASGPNSITTTYGYTITGQPLGHAQAVITLLEG